MKVAVLLSGGVDSSVALGLLAQQEGIELTAFYLKIWLEDDLAFLGECPWEEDLTYARAVCEQLQIPLRVVPLQKAYFDRVVDHALTELKAGRTPSPDILCNQQIKFGIFVDQIGDEFDKVASGHYAKIVEEDGVFHLHSAPDPVKDQTYFLSALSQKQLSRILFPLGDLNKGEVRQLAQDFNLPTRDRRDSQGICFLGKINYRDFVKSYLGEQPGKMINRETGEIMGEHKGVWFHTIGQRQGLGLGGGPWYVVEKDLENNTLFISKTPSDKRLKQLLTIAPPHWITTKPEEVHFEVKLRHGPKKVNATLTGEDTVTLETGDAGVAPGQSVIFYRGTECLGSALILKAK